MATLVERELQREFPLDRKKIWKKFLERVPIVGFLSLWLMGAGIGGGAVLASFGLGFLGLAVGLLGPAIGIGGLAFLWYWSNEYYNRYYYSIEGKSLKVKKGVFFPNSASIPLEKISDIYSDQDLLDRIFGIYDLHFSSASQTSGNLSHIDGLSLGAMENLRKVLKGSIVSEKTAIAKAQVPELAEQVFKPAGGRAYAAKLLGTALQWLVLVIYLVFNVSVIFRYPAILLPIGLGILLVAAFFVKLEVDSISYSVMADGIKVRTGWLTPKESFVFYGNIQDVEKTEGIIERLLSLATVSVKSMSFESALSTRLALLSREDSLEIERIVKEKTRSFLSTKGKGISSAKIAEEKTPLPGEKRLFAHRFLMDNLIGTGYFSLWLLLLAGIGSAIVWNIPQIEEKGLIIALAFGGWLAITAFFLALSAIGALIERISLSYQLTGEGVVICRDFITRQSKTIKYEKIQDVRINCGTAQSFFGIVSVSLETGSKEVYSDKHGEHATPIESALERIPSLNLADALKFREAVILRMGVSQKQGRETLRSKVDLAGIKPVKKTLSAFFVPVFLGKALVFYAILSGILSGNWKALLPSILVLGGILFGMLLKFLYEREYYRKYWYDENPSCLSVRKGVFGWSEIVIPYRNIQTVYVDQDYFDVPFGLYDVWVTTVTGASSNLSHIDGVKAEGAEGLARFFAERVEAARK